MEELIKFYKELLSIWKNILNKYELFLGGGTALMLKYKHRISYDLDFFSFKDINLQRILRELAFELPFSFDFSIEFPVLIVSNRRFTTKIEIHKRKNVKLLDFEEIFGIKKLSDLDILLEKIYFIERKKNTDIFDIKFLLEKLHLKEEEIIEKLMEKFNITEEYANYLWKITKESLSASSSNFL